MAANTNPKGKGAGHGPELIQRTRKAVLNTFNAIEKKGKLISEILADEFEKNPIKFMELAAKLMPKEINGDINHTHSLETLSDDELEQRINDYREIIESMQTGLESINGDGGNQTIN